MIIDGKLLLFSLNYFLQHLTLVASVIYGNEMFQ
jgi:hypothetical protein